MPARRATPVLVPMTEADFADFRAAAVTGYAAEKVASGQWSPEQSLDLSRKNFDELLPEGLNTVDHHLYCVVDDQGQAIGTLWIAAKERAGKRIAYIYDIAIRPEHRRRGHAVRAMRAAEDEARRLELCGIGLHVFGHNAGARALYETLGYQPTNINMFKPL